MDAVSCFLCGRLPSPPTPVGLQETVSQIVSEHLEEVDSEAQQSLVSLAEYCTRYFESCRSHVSPRLY